MIGRYLHIQYAAKCHGRLGVDLRRPLAKQTDEGNLSRGLRFAEQGGWVGGSLHSSLLALPITCQARTGTRSGRT